ncbi:MAG: 50S ribosomal protein L21 [Planctomycetota bacterium]
MYAVIEDSGTQIKVAEGDTIKVAERELAEDAVELTFDRVLLVGGDGELKVGQPVVSGASVEGEVLSEEAGEKVRIVKYKRRKNYRRTKGHRQPYLLVKVTKINAG